MQSSISSIPPVSPDYIPQGTVFNLGSLPVYETSKANNNGVNRVIVCAYDIFGLHPLTQHFADFLALGGYRVVIPDFFRGQGFPLENFPPKDRGEIINFLTEKGQWKRTVKADIEAVLAHYKEKEGVSCFGIIGLCWGARVARNCLIEYPEFQVGAFLYPTFWRFEEAFQIHRPLLLIASNDEDDMIPFFNVLKERLGEEKCAHYRFDDIHHGFASARADLTNELNRKRVDEALDLLHKFFDKFLIISYSHL